MSGMNVIRQARKKREEESLVLRKQILKSNAVGVEAELFQRISDTGKDYQDRIAQLTKFKSKSKAVTKIQTQQSEWKTEQALLRRMSDAYERDISASLEVLVLHTTTATPCDDEGNYNLQDIHSIVEDMSIHRAHLYECKKGLKFQLHELKSMLQDLIKDAQQKANNNTHSSSATNKNPHKLSKGKENHADLTNSQKVAGMSAGTAVFADLILQMRTHHAQLWKPLYESECDLWKAVKEENRKITNMLRTERKEQQTQDLRSELQIVDGDDVEVEMFMEEWLNKLATLDNAHQRNLQQFVAERVRVTAGATSEDHMDSSLEGKQYYDGVQEQSRVENVDTATELTDVSQEEEIGDIMGKVNDVYEDSIIDGGDSVIDGGDSIVNGGDSMIDGTGVPSHDDGSIEGDMTSIASMTSTSQTDGAVMHTVNEYNNIRSSSSSSNHNKPRITDHNLPLGLKGKQQYGGWNSQDHELFAKIFRRAVTSGMLRKPLLEALRTQLPHRKESDILHHEEWYRQMRLISNRQKECIVAYESARTELAEQASEQLRALRHTLVESNVKAKEMEEWEASRAQQHLRLQELRLLREEKERIFAEEQRIINEIEQRRREEEDALVSAERAWKKEQVMEYKTAKEMLYEAQQRLQEEARQQAAEALKREIERTRDNVQTRQDLFEEKIEKKRKHEEEMKLAEIARLEMLTKLAEQVPYWENILNAKANLSHITASAKGHEYQPSMEEITRGHIPLNGFSDGKVIRDARFRLATALREAGVHQSEAAKYAVQHAHPRPHLAIHGILY